MKKYQDILQYAQYFNPNVESQKFCGEYNNEGDCQLPFFNYSEKLTEFMRFFQSSNYVDYNYRNAMEKNDWYNEENLQKSIPTMTASEVLTCITAIIRQERFCEGLLDSFIKKGIMSSLMVRLDELA